MQDLSITEFRRQCLSLLENLPAEGLTISKRGRALARVTPVGRAKKGRRVQPPLVKAKGRPGPLRPSLKTPYDLIFD
jgi:antitoxin (DNA-binding transcriptional repressor) of toxin-antitoxin stability system